MKFLNTIWGSWVKMFVALMLVKFLEMGGDLFSLNFASIKAILTAAVVGVLPVLINWLNPSDNRYGIKQ